MKSELFTLTSICGLQLLILIGARSSYLYGNPNSTFVLPSIDIKGSGGLTHQRNSAVADLGADDSNEALFTAALAQSEYDLASFNGNVSDLATRLIRYDGCNRLQKQQIYAGWQQSWKIMNLIYKEAKNGIDWNSAAAVEYLGAPLMNRDYQKAITGTCSS
jgi:hypothetical protein